MMVSAKENRDGCLQILRDTAQLQISVLVALIKWKICWKDCFLQSCQHSFLFKN